MRTGRGLQPLLCNQNQRDEAEYAFRELHR